ncbi:MAG: mechanosensitive ion channel [Methylobacillus sp.]|jgi:small-conductance mechanosensitive channel|nr:mechanosensitive ion channel [Methylobacillus sp.]
MQAWTEIIADLRTPASLWQLAVVAFSLLLAGAVNKLILRKDLMHRVSEEWQRPVKQVLFPVSALVFVYLGMLILHQWQPVGLLRLAIALLIAFALSRLIVHALRYIFAPSAWLTTVENVIAGVVWILVALHLVGFLPRVLDGLDAVSFMMGQTRVSVLLVLQAIITVVAAVVAALWVSRLFENRIMRATHINMNMRVVFAKLLRVILTVVGVMVALSAIGFDITLLSVFGGALGVGLGFGLQKIASNYVSGFIILLDESVHINDVVTIGEHYGVISQIRSRYLVLRKLDGTEVVIPNETLISSPVINHSYSDRNARVPLPIQISYDSSPELALAILLEVAQRHPRILKDPAPDAQLLGFGECGIDLQLVVWIPDPEAGSGSLKSTLYLEIWNDFLAAGIKTSSPTRDVRIVSDAPPQG